MKDICIPSICSLTISSFILRHALLLHAIPSGSVELCHAYFEIPFHFQLNSSLKKK
jgi:hypothetical protein